MADPEHGEDRLYLVRETKSTLDLDQLRPDEKRKILCGRSHFRGALEVDYKLMGEAAQLPDGDKRIFHSQRDLFGRRPAGWTVRRRQLMPAYCADPESLRGSVKIYTIFCRGAGGAEDAMGS